jgi:hypothetical protein
MQSLLRKSSEAITGVKEDRVGSKDCSKAVLLSPYEIESLYDRLIIKAFYF